MNGNRNFNMLHCQTIVTLSITEMFDFIIFRAFVLCVSRVVVYSDLAIEWKKKGNK